MVGLDSAAKCGEEQSSQGVDKKRNEPWEVAALCYTVIAVHIMYQWVGCHFSN